MKKRKLPECCERELKLIKWGKDITINKKRFKTILRSTSLYRCCLCGKIIGGCSFGHEYDFPVLLWFKNRMIALCGYCFIEKSGLVKWEIKGWEE